MLSYRSRVAFRFVSWRDDAFIRFVWWRDIPALLWFALFGPREAGNDAPGYLPPRTWEKEVRGE